MFIFVDTDSLTIVTHHPEMIENFLPEKRADFETIVLQFIVPDRSHPLYDELRVRPYMVKVELDNIICGVCSCPKDYAFLAAQSFKLGSKGVGRIVHTLLLRFPATPATCKLFHS